MCECRRPNNSKATGYLRRVSSSHYDRGLALDRHLVLRFIKETQPEAWGRLVQHYASSADATFFKQLERYVHYQSCQS